MFGFIFQNQNKSPILYQWGYHNNQEILAWGLKNASTILDYTEKVTPQCSNKMYYSKVSKSQLILFANFQTHINSNNPTPNTKERSGRSRHLFSFYWPAQNALVNKKIVSLKRRIPSWGFSCSSQLPKSCGLLCFAFYYMSFYLYNSFCYNRLESQSIMSLQGRRIFLKSGGESSHRLLNCLVLEVS